MLRARYPFVLPTLCASALLYGLVACATSEVELEPRHASLGCDAGESACTADGGVGGDGADNEDQAAGGACLWIVVGFGTGETVYDVLVNGRRLSFPGTSGDEDHIITHGDGGGTSFCVTPGSHRLALSRRGKTVAQLGEVPLTAGKQVVVVAYGNEAQPSVKVSEVDLTPAGPGMRRMRITNLLPGQEPLRLTYHDQQDRLIARSRIVAHGDTDIGTIPADVTFWRLEGEPTRWQITAGNGDSEHRCVEPQTAGVILLARDPAQTWGALPQEMYQQPTQDCEPAAESLTDAGLPRAPYEVYFFPVEP